MKLCRSGLGLLLASGAWAQPYVISTIAGGAPPPTPAAAVNASIGRPWSTATDAARNMYFSSGSCVFKRDTGGVLTRVAGSCRPGYSGDGGPATSAQLYGDRLYLALDRAGNLYISEYGGHRVRKVTPGGTITTVAGIGISDYTSYSVGDGQPATSVQVDYPNDIAIDSAGNLYIANGDRVRKVSSDGIITTAATMPAQSEFASSMAMDNSGNLYIASMGSARVRKVSPGGVWTTVAGTGTLGYSGDGGPATAAQLGLIDGLAVDAANNLYIADMSNNRIRKVTAGGTITTVAGNGEQSYSGDGGPATAAAMQGPQGISLDSSGNLYVVEPFDNRVRQVSIGGVITTVAGNGSGWYFGDGVAATAGSLDPYTVTADEAGNLYIAEYANHRVRKVSPGGIITTVAGTGAAGFAGDNGPATAALLTGPLDVAADGAGNVYIADAARVRKISTAGTITTIAGTGRTRDDPREGVPATTVELNPLAVAAGRDGSVYILDLGSRVRRVWPNGIITTVAGGPARGYAGDGGPAAGAQLAGSMLTVDDAGNLYIADYGNSRVRKITPGGIITTVAGNGGFDFSGDGGMATAAHLDTPYSVAADAVGNIYIADSGNARVRKVSPGGIITTIAGSAVRINGSVRGSGYSGDGGPAGDAQLYSPRSITVDRAGNVYVADANAVRMLRPAAPVALTITSAALPPGLTGASYSAPLEALGGSASYTWSLASGSLPAGLSLSNSGRIAGVPAAAGTFTFTVQVSDAGSTRATRELVLVILADSRLAVVTPVGLPAGAVGGFYTQSLTAAGGAPPYSWSIASGALPAGLTLASAGGIGGTPTVTGTYTFTARVADGAGASATATFSLRIDPAVVVKAVVNAASSLSGPIAPGEIVVLYGSGVGPGQLANAQLNDAGLVDTLLAATTVRFNGALAPLIYTSANQVAAVVPYRISGGSAQVTVTYQGHTSAALSVPIAASAPGIFTADSSGQGQAAAINQDGSPNSAASPATGGDIITFWATGEGETTPSGVDGKLASSVLPAPTLLVNVLINGQTARIVYKGAAPGQVAGLMQVNVEIPPGVPAGNTALFLQVGNASSPEGVTLAIR